MSEPLPIRLSKIARWGWVWLGLVIISGLIFGSASLADSYRRPTVEAGFIDLSGHDFEQDGLINLDGEWEFYWGRHLAPEFFARPEERSAPHLIRVPSAWNEKKVTGGEISSKGAATYRVRVRLGPTETPLSLRIRTMATSYAVLANGRKLHQVGVPGLDAAATKAKYRSSIIELPPTRGELELILWVANFEHRKGGARSGILIGPTGRIHNHRLNHLALSFVMMGGLLVMGLYHLALSVIRHQDRSNLYFGLFCLLITIRVMFTGERYVVDLWPGIPWDFQIRVEYLTYYLGAMVLPAFVNTLFPHEFDTRVLKAIVISSGLFAAGVVIFRPVLFNEWLGYFHLITILALAYLLWVIGRAKLHHRPGATTFSIGFIFLFSAIVNDILLVRGVLDSFHSVPLGLLLFTCSQAYILSRRYALAFTTVENQRLALMAKNKDIERELAERRKAEKALAASEERFRRMAELLPETVFETNMDGRLTYANQAARSMFGLTRTTLNRGASAQSMISGRDQERLERDVSSVLAGQRVREVEFLARHADGHHFPIVIYMSPIINEAQEPDGVRGIVIDVTERKRIEAHLREAQKLEAVGTLAGGIAHDFNNILQTVSGNVQLLKLAGNQPRENRDRLDQIDRAVDRAAELVKRLLAYGRKVEPSLAPIDLNQEILETAKVLERTLPRMVNLETDLEPDLEPINGDVVQVQQVLLNLAANAGDAMPEGGTLRFSTARTVIAENQNPASIGLEPGSYVRMTVSDTGIGMDRETRGKIFDPFFTTKEVGKGTGLGLAMVFGIVAGHKGAIECRSRKGKGTEFVVYWPSRPDSAQADRAAPEDTEVLAGHGRRILIVDDEEPIRGVLAEFLTNHGYRVTEACSGEEALEIYGQDGARFDLVLMDLSMPGMGGREAILELRRLNPGAVVVVASGYLDETRIRAALEAGAREFVHKPYRLEKLLATLGGLISETPEGRIGETP